MKPLAEADHPPGSSPYPAGLITALYEEHALGLLRLAVIMLGDRPSAEDVVQDAFFGLYRRLGSLRNPDRALGYVRSSVFNGCRTVLRRRARDRVFVLTDADAESAEASVLLSEEHREVLAALRRLPDRQREVVALRYCLDLPPAEVARAMGISLGTVKSATSRGLAALARIMKENS